MPGHVSISNAMLIKLLQSLNLKTLVDFLHSILSLMPHTQTLKHTKQHVNKKFFWCIASLKYVIQFGILNKKSCNKYDKHTKMYIFIIQTKSNIVVWSRTTFGHVARVTGCHTHAFDEGPCYDSYNQFVSSETDKN